MSAPPERRTGGLLLAAGRSRRMGTAKIFLPWPTAFSHRTVLDGALDGLAALVSNGPVFIVTSHENRSSVERAVRHRAVTLIEADGDAPMFNSIRTGLTAMHERFPELDGLWLHPADHPEITPAVRSTLLAAVVETPDCAVMPEHGGRGGHPVWIPAAWIDRLLTLDDTSGGLRAVWERHAGEVQRVSVDDASAVLDLDTPEAYRRAIDARKAD